MRTAPVMYGREMTIPNGADSIGLGQRPELPSDDAFRFALFCQSRGPGEDFAFLDPVLREKLMRQQFVGQSASYRTQYSTACFEILEVDHEPIGRLAVADGAEAITIIDLALLPNWRGRGIGTYVINAKIAKARATAKPARLSVFASNTGALRLYRRLGFEICGTSEIEIHMEYKMTSY